MSRPKSDSLAATAQRAPQACAFGARPVDILASPSFFMKSLALAELGAPARRCDFLRRRSGAAPEEIRK